ncbi:MAG: 5-dehydro-4-deoxy-D-glucuronate isomerase [Clostridiales bacterium]|jgi:4-deoxy-L-threo-5-hexosulose-uronate ketol-isomerase|nr:5-dehydro-4-deoxy-D-glucuronate isomerase [Clostridiales bacterium]
MAVKILDKEIIMREKHSTSFHEFISLDTEQLRTNFLIEELFKINSIEINYAYSDRMIVGGACPQNTLELTPVSVLHQNYFLERREMGVINIGGTGSICVNDVEFELNTRDGLYIGMGNESIQFSSLDASNPAKFYFISTPAHCTFPTTKISFSSVGKVDLGSVSAANERTLYKYIHPEGVKSCQLVMGFTDLKEGSVWNSIPPHTHERRSEIYCYFDMPQQDIVFHFMGSKDQTKHIVVKNEQAVLSPYWSIHSGAGTTRYAFIWAMAGENQLFQDAQSIDISELK